LRAIALVAALAVGCGADEASRLRTASPASDGTVVPMPDMPAPSADGPDSSVADPLDAAVAERAPEAAALPGVARALLPEPSFGASEPLKPGEAHAFRLIVAVRAARASRSGAKVMEMLSLLPDVREARARTGVDPFADGEWLLVYGGKVAVPGPNANVVKHTKADADVTKALTARARGAEIYGVKDVLLRPQPGILALVPGDRAPELGVVLSKAIDPGVKPGELARAFVAEPAKLLRFLPAELVRANVIVKGATDGGLDASAEVDCPDAASCKATATALEELGRTQNTLMVRIVTKNILGGLGVHADGAKLKATLHAAPDQVDAALNLTRAQLGLPAVSPREPNKR
jgi:hypothetical protein